MSLALIFSAIGAGGVAISSFAKTKERMLIWQLIDYFFTATANFLLGGYTGALSICISIIRNALIIKNRDTKAWLIFLVLIQVSLGLVVNHLGIIGMLPIISSISYTLAIFLTSNTQILRWIIVENMSLWAVYDMTIGAYPALLMDIFVVSSSLIALWRYHKRKNRTEP